MEEGDQEGKAASEDHPCGHLGPTLLGNSGRWFRECFRGLLVQGQGHWAIYPVASPGHWVGALAGVSMPHMRAKQLWQLEETFRQGQWDCRQGQGADGHGQGPDSPCCTL